MKRTWKSGISLLLSVCLLFGMGNTVLAAENDTVFDYVAITGTFSAVNEEGYPELLVEYLNQNKPDGYTSVKQNTATDSHIAAADLITVDIGSDYFGTDIAQTLMNGSADFSSHLSAYQDALDATLAAIFTSNPDAHVIVIGVNDVLAGMTILNGADVTAHWKAVLAQANAYAETGNPYARRHFFALAESALHTYGDQIAEGEASKHLKSLLQPIVDTEIDNSEIVKNSGDYVKGLLDDSTYGALLKRVGLTEDVLNQYLDAAIAATKNRAVDDVLVPELSKLLAYKTIDLPGLAAGDYAESQIYQMVSAWIAPPVAEIGLEELGKQIDILLSKKEYSGLVSLGKLFGLDIKGEIASKLAEGKASIPQQPAFTDAEKSAIAVYLRLMFEDGLLSRPDSVGAEQVFTAILNAKMPRIEYQVKNHTGAADAQTWKIDEQAQTIHVRNDDACVVALEHTDGTYTRLNAAVNADGGYDFDISGFSGGDFIVIVKKGDMNMDGEIRSNEITQARSMLLGKGSLTGVLQKMIADVNGDGELRSNEVTQLRAALLGKNDLTW